MTANGTTCQQWRWHVEPTRHPCSPTSSTSPRLQQPLQSAIAGCFGYIAPEYAQTVRVNEKTDIYSFGVVLLELTTGKAATYGDEYTCLAKWALRQMQEGKPIVDALDEEIKEPCYLDEMSNVFRLGVVYQHIAFC
ncbi:hypothetical protein Peur_045348 [Populus x canadensis]